MPDKTAAFEEVIRNTLTAWSIATSPPGSDASASRMRVSEAETAIIAFVRVDDPTMEMGDESCAPLPWNSATTLCNWGVRFVCVSTAAADYIRQVQRELQIVEAFICEGGAALHVPGAYLHGVADSDGHAECQWDVFRFNPPNRGAAVTLVRDLFLARGWCDPLTIGVGWDCDDYGVLANVNIPIVVRDGRKEQSVLLRHVPGAYITAASGHDGWSEALIGSSRT
jgi:hypothetical protein